MANFQRQVKDKSTSLVTEDIDHVIRVCLQHDRVREASDAICQGEKHGLVATSESHFQVCYSWAAKGHADRALAMMPQLCARFRKSSHFDQSKSYDPLLAVFQSQGDWRNTHAAMTQMHQLGISPSLVAFRRVMVTAAKAQQRHVLQKTVEFVMAKFVDIWTDGRALTDICQAFLQVGDNQRVMDIYNQLDGNWLDTKGKTALFNQFLLAAIRSGDVRNETKQPQHDRAVNVSLATTIFHRMQNSERASPDDFTFATYMRELEKEGEWARVLDLFQTMVDMESTTSVFNALSCSIVIRALHMQGEKADAKEPSRSICFPSFTNSQNLPCQLKQKLANVLKLLRTMQLKNVNHASTLIDTLDKYHLYTPARQIFQRVLDAKLLHETFWRRKNGCELDLHRFSRGMAKCAVVFAFDELTHAFAKGAVLQDVRIITGIGKHSQTFMKPVLRHEIVKLLTKSSRPLLLPTMHETNPGVLLVRRNALQKWLFNGGTIRYF